MEDAFYTDAPDPSSRAATEDAFQTPPPPLPEPVFAAQTLLPVSVKNDADVSRKEEEINDGTLQRATQGLRLRRECLDIATAFLMLLYIVRAYAAAVPPSAGSFAAMLPNFKGKFTFRCVNKSVSS